ncbi:DNA polymerase III subunit delta [Spiroplasma sp. AdecLV25b]|uniref:DNA polymerase III subunit delta n=1 Tax=Spiroplasma sp. AdecLV25b TaxID=3027162 RepID=UPI0027DF7717|nr:DNA polymerase III subunit delta [Spiroplasma sp. AdecLV25b]
MVHIVHGQDQYLIKKNIESLIKKHHKNNDYNYSSYQLHDTTIANIISEIETISLFETNKILVINDENHEYLKHIKDERFSYALLNHSDKVMIIIKIQSDDFKTNNIDSSFNIIKVKNYTKVQLELFINKVCASFKISITKPAIDFLTANLPNEVNVFINELKKLRSINELITLEIVQEIVPHYFNNNVFKTIDYLLKKDYKKFWIQFNYYNTINYDKIKMINILAYQLELIRDIKILINQNHNYEQISRKINIPTFQVKLLSQYAMNILYINNNLLKLYELDADIKKGKCDKNIAIDLFFLSF